MKTIVLGASPNPERYAYEAVVRLLSKGHEVIPIGIRQGKTAGDLDIINDMPLVENVHTVTLYISSDIQAEYYD
jgi:predicted CoA-binding protein